MSCDSTVLYQDATVYVNNDNAVVVKPYSNYASRINYDMTPVTKVVAVADLATSTVSGDGVTGDSSIDPLLVFWNNTTDPSDDWLIYCKVGRFTGIVAGVYTLRITIYDPDHINGYVLPDTAESLRVTVVGEP